MQTPSFRFTLLIIIAMISWGFSWSSGKAITRFTRPDVLLFWRFFLTFISLIPVVYFSGHSVRIEKKAIKFVLLGGLILSFYNYLFFAGLKLGLAGAGGVLVTTLNPVITFILSSILHKYKPHGKELIGIFLGLVGGLVMIHIWKLSWEQISLGGNLFFLLAAFIWALLSINGQYSGKSLSPLIFSLYVYGISSLLNLGFAWGQDLFSVFALPSTFWLNLVYLSIVSTTFGTTVYFFAASRYGSKVASSFIFIVPVSAVLGSIFFLQETPDSIVILGGFLALIAVYLINSPQYSSQKATSTK